MSHARIIRDPAAPESGDRRIADHWTAPRPARPARPHRAIGRPIGRPRQATSCSVDGCHRPHRARGLCNTHWARVYRYGWPDPLTPPPPPPDVPPLPCRVADCDGKRFGYGYCQTHYRRVYMLGWDTPERKRVRP